LRYEFGQEFKIQIQISRFICLDWVSKFLGFKVSDFRVMVSGRRFTIPKPWDVNWEPGPGFKGEQRREASCSDSVGIGLFVWLRCRQVKALNRSLKDGEIAKVLMKRTAGRHRLDCSEERRAEHRSANVHAR